MILIVDDNEYLSHSIQELFNSNKLDSIIVSDGKEALSAIEKQDFSVIIADMHMPNYNGLELVERLSETNYPAEIIVFSGHITRKEMLQLMSYKKVFAVHQKSDLIEKLLLSVKKAEEFNDRYTNLETTIH